MIGTYVRFLEVIPTPIASGHLVYVPSRVTEADMRPVTGGVEDGLPVVNGQKQR